MTNNAVSTHEDQPRIIPTIKEPASADDEFNRLYSRYKRTGYELIAVMEQEHQKLKESVDLLVDNQIVAILFALVQQGGDVATVSGLADPTQSMVKNEMGSPVFSEPAPFSTDTLPRQ